MEKFRRVDLPVKELCDRYRIAGESACEIASAYGVSSRTVRRRLHEAGVEVRPGGGPAGNKHGLGNKSKLGQHKRGGPLHDDGRGYLGTLDREAKLCRIHRGCWEAYRGAIPAGHVVHHINGDKFNNHIENLLCMSDAEHKRLHGRVALLVGALREHGREDA